MNSNDPVVSTVSQKKEGNPILDALDGWMDGWMDGNRASVCTSTVVLCSYETNCSLVTMTMPFQEKVALLLFVIALLLWRCGCLLWSLSRADALLMLLLLLLLGQQVRRAFRT